MLLVFLIGTALTVFLAQRASDAERQIAQSRFEQEARSRILLVEELIQAQLRELDALRRFVTLEGELTHDQFEALTQLSDRIEMTVAWTENVPASRMDAYRERMKRDYGEAFRIRLPASVESLSSGDIRRSFPITFQKTSVPGVDLVGVDTSYLPTRVKAYEQAMSTGKAVLVGGVRTLDEPDDQSGILVFTPVFEKGTGEDITERHFGNLRGFLGMGLRLSDLAALVSSAHGERAGVTLEFQHISALNDAHDHRPGARPKPDGMTYSRDLDLADGAVSIVARPANPADWQPRATDLLVLLVGIAASLLCAGYLGMALVGRSRAEENVARRTEELRSTMEALSASEARWQFALDGSGDGVWDWNVPANVVFYSDGWKAMFGYGPDEVGSSMSEWSDRVHPDDLESCQHALEAHFRGESAYFENIHRVRCKDGTWKWILDRGKVVEWTAGGEPVRVIGTHSDISGVKQTELELREANAYLSGILASAEDVAIITADLSGKVTLFNRGAEKLLGYRADEVIGVATPELFHDPAEVAVWARQLSKRHGRDIAGFEVFRTAIEDGFRSSERWNLVRKDGEKRQVQLTQSTIHDAAGETLGYLGVATDMTEYLRAMDALEQNSNLLQDLTANVPGAIYQFLIRPDGTSCFPYISDGVRKIFEMTPDEARESADVAMQRIHPDDVRPVWRSIRQSMDAMVPWISEYRVRLPSYGERWLRGESTPRRTADGGTLWHGYISDISEIKKLEFQLREQATVDPLTGTFNRRHLESQWNREMARYRRSGMSFAMIMLDIDHFKEINDTHGHGVGDQALIRLGRFLRHDVRSTDVVYRLGGEEFLVLCEDTDLLGATKLAELLREQLRTLPMPFAGHLTASFGVVEVAMEETMPAAFKRLDELLYLAKESGRDQVMAAPVEPVS